MNAIGLACRVLSAPAQSPSERPQSSPPTGAVSVRHSQFQNRPNVKGTATGKWVMRACPDRLRLSDLEPLFTCQACGIKGAELRPDFDWGARRDNLVGKRNDRRPLHMPEMARDCWLEVVRCPHCGKMGEALISAEDFLLDFHVGSIPHGFKVIPSNELGSFIFCASCDMPVEP